MSFRTTNKKEINPIKDFDFSNTSGFIKSVKKIKKVVESDNNLTIDTRRNVNSKEKEQIWNCSQTDINFDKRYFRIDILGNLCIKNIKYNNNYNESKKFAFEYEHFISYSNYGKSDTNNVCLLNAGINRSKSNNAVYTLTFNENHGLCRRYAISGRDLDKELRLDLHETCKKYNIYFTKVNNEWTINEYSYNDQNITLWIIPDKPLPSTSKVRNFINDNNLYEDNTIPVGIITGVVSGLSMLLTGLIIGHNTKN